MNLSIFHIAVMLATVFSVIAAGLCAARSVRSSEGYALGGRSAGVPMIAGSIAGTIVGGGATVGTAQLAYTCGLSAWWFTLGSGIAFIIMGLFYASRLRGTGLATIPEFLAAHYGTRAEEASSLIASAGMFFSVVASTLPGIQILSAFFGVSHAAAAAILAVLVMGYTFFGGMKSAGIGGILKMGIIFFALFAAGFSAFRGLLSINDFSAVFPDTPWLSLFGAGTDTALASLFSVVVGVLCTQTYVQAVFSAATPWEAAAGCFTAAAVTIPVGLPSVAIGMYMRAFDPNVLPVLVLPSYLISHESEWLAGIALGGILLSLIGSIGGLSLGIGTMIARDMAGEIFHIKNDKMLLRITKGAVLAVLIAASLVSAANAGSQVLFWNYLSMALRGGGIFLPLSLAIFRPGLIPKSWALASMLLSTAVSLLLTFFPVFSVNPLFAGLAVSTAVLAAGFLSVKTQK